MARLVVVVVVAALAAVVAVAAAAPSSDPEWVVSKNANQCGSECGCSGSHCTDTPGKTHFVNTLDTMEACALTCTNSGGNCSAWVWSGSSHHCWWMLNVADWSPTAATNIFSGCRAAPMSDCVPGCGNCPVPPPPAPTPINPSKEPNMNGDYVIAATPKAGNISLFPSQYRDYPGGTEYFDVYSPMIEQLYSQVYWTRMDTVPLPEEIIKRFDGRTMAVVGFEVNQVRKLPDGSEVTVPINVVYNHHFESDMIGKAAKLIKVDQDDPRVPRTGHHHPYDPEGKVTIVHDPHADTETPSSAAFGAANGGEWRKSFHGFAPGFAKIIQSPQAFSFTPMQIDTWNRDKMNLTGGPFVPGPVPLNSLAPKDGPDAIYSGLLECPVTTRIHKVVDGAYATQIEGSCGYQISSMGECFAAASSMGPANTNYTDATGTDPSMPPGCNLILGALPAPGQQRQARVFYNNANTTGVKCGGSDTPVVTEGAAQSLVNLSVSLDPAKQEATITMAGPAAVWFGVGFNAEAMKDEPWAIIVEGTGDVSERKLADQNPGTLLSPSVKVVSSSVTDGVRTVTMTRPFKGATSAHYTFNQASDTLLHFINAIGSTPKLSYHKDKTASTIAILPTNKPVCVCDLKPAPFGQAKGSLKYGDTVVGFGNKCAPQPRTDLLAQHNPTCDVRTYAGGQTACHHMWSLLDADQEIPWADKPLQYQMKFRFHFQNYEPASGSKPASHQNVKRTTWGIASPVEYDVPQCPAGTPTKDCIHKITGLFAAPSNTKLVAAHFHCHAPTCLDVTMYNNETGEIICREQPLYGGTGKIDRKSMDEPGYIAVPPCLWGSPEHGLQEPYDVSGKMLYVVKHSNSTYGHHGEMAWLQMLYV
eukprot:m.477668 g.477668  ORF g.477668 m.477668 type:complete len:870 (+) comp20913_c0_seq1:229-2838(+)